MERILCAAIYFNDIAKHEHQPKNIVSGFVVAGMRHHNCFATLQAIGEALGYNSIARNNIERIDEIQGFITSENRFVDRYDGLPIALNAEQVISGKTSGKLFSEDLY